MRKAHAAVMAIVVAVGVAPWLIFWTSLPPTMASHWGASGRADGHMPRLLLFLVFAAAPALLAACALGAARYGSALPRSFSGAVGLSFTAGLMSVISLAIVVEQRDVTSWRGVRVPFGWMILAFAIGVLAATVGGAALPKASPDVGRHSAVAVGRNEVVAWAGHARAPWVLALSLVTVAVGAILLPTASISLGTATIVAGLAVAWFSTTHVVAGRSGVRVRGAFGWPTVSIPLERIESAEAIGVVPMQWGGWGYRGSLRLMHRAAWVVRRGEALKLTLRRGATGVQANFVVTVDDAETAAAVLNGLLGSSSARVAR